MCNRLTGATLIVLFAVGSVSTLAANDDPTAEQIIHEMEELYRAQASKAHITMRIQTPHYDRTLEMQSRTLGEEKALIRILSPRKDRGIATLKLDDEMWNYFPKINKVIKVPPSMMMGSWMGSDFTNDDLVRQTDLTEDYELGLAETQETWEITLVPKENTVTLWGKILYVVDKNHNIPRSQVFFDDNGKKVRRLEFSNTKTFSDKLIPSVLEMIPLTKEGHRTVVTYEDLDLNPDDVNEDIFSLRNLQSRF